jgi:hypothetical protein
MLNWWSMRLLLYLWPWMCNLISRWRYITPTYQVTHPRPQVQQQTHGPPIEHYILPPTYQVTHPRPQVQQQTHGPPIEHYIPPPTYQVTHPRPQVQQQTYNAQLVVHAFVVVLVALDV